MLLSNQTISDFSVKFSDDFLLASSKEMFSDYFDENNGMFRKESDYLNATIIGIDSLGFSSAVSKQQGNRDRTRTFQGSLIKDFKIKKTLNITFALKWGYLNYYMLYFNSLEYSKIYDLFFPPIVLDIFDDNGNIVVRYEYREIQITDIDPITLKKTDNGIGSKEFSAKFSFNELKIHTFFNKNKSKDLNSSYEHNFKNA